MAMDEQLFSQGPGIILTLLRGMAHAGPLWSCCFQHMKVKWCQRGSKWTVPINRSLCAITYWHVHLLPQTMIRPDHCSGKGWMEQRKGNQLNILKRTICHSQQLPTFTLFKIYKTYVCEVTTFMSWVKCLPGAICIPDISCCTFTTDRQKLDFAITNVCDFQLCSLWHSYANRRTFACMPPPRMPRGRH